MKECTFPISMNDLLPPLQPCDSVSLQREEVLILAPGFEDRTLAIPQMLAASHGARAILLEFSPYNPGNKLSDVKEILLCKGVQVSDEDVITYNRFEPGDFEIRLQSRLVTLDARNVTIDISTMSKLEIILVLYVCSELRLHARVLYSEAQEYGPSQEEFEKARKENRIHQPTLQIFTGVHGVVRVTSLASVAMQGQPTAAIVFMSFNDALTQVLLNTVYPSRLFLINGRPPVHTWREEATAWIHDQVRREWEEDNPVEEPLRGGLAMPRRVASTLDYRETVSLLLRLYWQLSASHRVILTPSGSKFQAVASYLIKALHPDIHIEYTSPEGFSPNYSHGIGNRWLVELGQISEMISRISAAERHAYLEIPNNQDY